MVTSSRILKKTNTSNSKVVKVIEAQEQNFEQQSKRYILGIGRRKESTATVRLYQGEGLSTLNGKPIKVAPGFLTESEIFQIMQPFKQLQVSDKFYFTAKTSGGGVISRIGAINLASARALLKFDENLKIDLKKFNLLTRDSREVERKKAGLRKARKATQYSKR